MIINNVQMQNLYVVQENLNVRSGPGTSYTIIGGIKQYELVDVKHCLNNFAYIGNGQWVSQRYLERYTDGITQREMKNWKVTTMANLNMRTGPGTQYCKIGIIPKGKTVKVLKQENNWFKVKYKNKVFWLFGQYLG